MFTELMPMIEDRPLTITVTALKDGKIKLCVIPQPQDKDTKANKKAASQSTDIAKIPDAAVRGLTTPLAITGTPQEVDAGLVEALTRYVQTHVTLQQGIEQATREITEAVKALEERRKAKTKPEPKKDTKNEGDPDPAAKQTDTSGAQKAPHPKRELNTTIPLDWCTPAGTDQQGANSTNCRLTE